MVTALNTPGSFASTSEPQPESSFLPPGVSPSVFLPATVADWVVSAGMGVLLMQVLSYHRKYGKSDPRWTKGAVYVLFCLNVASFSTSFSRAIKIRALHLCDFGYYISFHNRPDDCLLFVLTATIISLAQLFMITRSWLFARSLRDSTRTGRTSRLSVACFVVKIFLWILATAMGYAGTIVVWTQFETYAPLGSINKITFVGKLPVTTVYFLYLVSSSLLDTTIAISLSWDLHRAKTGQESSGSVLSTFITVTLANGVVLAVVQAVALVLYFVGATGWSDAASSITSRIATITCLASILRPREAYRQQLRLMAEREAAFFAPLNYTSEATTGCSTCVCGRTATLSPRVGTKALEEGMLVLDSVVGGGGEEELGLVYGRRGTKVEKGAVA